ncbi:MAG: cytochrome c maturation protein CcmE [Alphaproteobacteria bacterium]
MRRRNRRLLLAISCVALAGGAAGLALWALRNTATYFYSPSDLAALATKPSGDIRIGGLVERGSISRFGAQSIEFKVTDLKSELAVSFSGVAPSLFREGQGVVAEGRLARNGKFEAHTILAKHDETYMPPEVAKALKERGLWEGATGTSPKTALTGRPGSQSAQ